MNRFIGGSVLLLLVAGLAAAASGVAYSPESRVAVAARAGGGWELLANGKPYVVKGVGGIDRLALAAEIGANTVRTWGAEDLEHLDAGVSVIDRAEQLDLGIVAGLWLMHESQGFDYHDPVQLQAQRERIRAEVRRYRDRPSILMWGVGNETEVTLGGSENEHIWREIETLLAIVKEEDSSRPVMTVIAGAGPEKIAAAKRFLPSLDVLGLNLYGGAALVSQLLSDAGWDRPFMLTEYGPLGPWEVLHTRWGAPIEPDSAAKMASLLTSQRMAETDPADRCLGTFAFHWGQKQEATATWFGLFLATGEKTPMVDILSHGFRNRWPVNRSPRLSPLRPSFANDRVAPGTEIDVVANAFDPDGDLLSYEWVVQSESNDRRHGGERENVPPVYPECVVSSVGNRAQLRLPQESGAYRLFVYVRDGHGGGCSENAAFFVEP